MNTKLEIKLSEADKKALEQIDRNFTMLELILGAEPGIYHEFNIRPVISEVDADLNNKRMEVFSGSAFQKV
jgi:hypothetical protein